MSSVATLGTRGSSAPRSRALDVLRAAALWMVLVRHMHPCPREVNPLLHDITTIGQMGGWTGVDLFFVLSGFLISGLLFREFKRHGAISLWRFYIRRALKIYPPFLALILIALANMIRRGEPIPWRIVANEIFFLQNYRPAMWAHTWSLAVEEHFYIVLPLALALALRVTQARASREPASHEFTSRSDPFAWVPVAFVVVAVGCLWLRLRGISVPLQGPRHYMPTHLRLDAIASGVLLGYLAHFHGDRLLELRARWKPFLVPLGVVCLLPAFAIDLQTSVWIHTWGFSLFWLGGALLVLGVRDEDVGRGRVAHAIAFVGSRSYSIYLFHIMLEVNFWRAAQSSGDPRSWYLYASAYFIGSLALGIVMAAIVEYPAVRLRDRLFPSRSGSLAPAQLEEHLPQHASTHH